MSTYTYKLADPIHDYEDAVSLLYTTKEELRLPDEKTCADVIDRCFEKGGIVLGYDGQTVASVGGFFWGDPNENYRDPSIAFLYVAAILPEYRLTRHFYMGLRHSLRVLKKMGACQIRLQAEKVNPYTNRLYSRFARPLGEGKSLRGIPVITYGNEIDAALAYFGGQWPVAQSKSTFAPSV